MLSKIRNLAVPIFSWRAGFLLDLPETYEGLNCIIDFGSLSLKLLAKRATGRVFKRTNASEIVSV